MPFGKYQLIATLGRGGMADVFLALMSGPVGFRKLVVIKRLREDVVDEGSLTSMLLDEAQLSARLQHPNVVQTFEVGVYEGRHYLAMEYLEGQPIANLLRSAGAVPPMIAAQVMGDALAGLEYAHTLRDYDNRPLTIVHRDVSPQNLFITYGGEVKVVDFGVAKTALSVSAETQTGVVKGKFGYMAPEQLNDGVVDARTDVYASGIVLWEMLTGKRLFRNKPGDGPTQSIARMLFAPVPRPTEIVPDVPAALEEICLRALDRDAQKRWPSAGAMREALYAYVEGAGGTLRREAIGDHVLALFGNERAEIKQRITASVAEAESATTLMAPSSLETLEPTRSDRPPNTYDSGDRSVPPPARTARMRSTQVATSPDPSLPSLPSLPSTAAVMPVRRKHPWLPLWIGGAVGAFVITTLIIGAVTKKEPAEVVVVTPDAAAAAAATTSARAPLLVLQGSGTIGVDAAPAFLEGFLKKRGATVVRREKGDLPADILVVGENGSNIETVVVHNAGTHVGFQGLAARTCDVAMAAREINDAEIADLAAKGLADPRSPASEHVIGLDGVAVVVNRSNPIGALDRDQLADVFSGATRDWSALGSTAPGPFGIFTHEDGSGTIDVFDSIVLRGRKLVATTHRMPDNDAITNAVTQDPNGIGFVGLAFVHGAKALALHDRGVAPMLPSAFTVTTERYLLTRRFYLYTQAPPKAAAVELVEYVLSDAGQQAIRGVGFIDLQVALKSKEPCEHCTPRYAKVTKAARRLSLDFRFRPGTNTLDARGTRDVDRVVRFLREHSTSRVLLAGFESATTDAKADAKHSKALAEAVESELQTRGVHASTIEGFGSEMPLAASDTDWGRAKNRRVEIWVIEDR